MNPNPDPEFEAQLTRELKALPSLSAPTELTARILSAVTAQAALPWYRRGWLHWPMQWRVVSFAALALGFIGLCACVASIFQSSEAIEWRTKLASVFGLAQTVFETLRVLRDAAINALQLIPPAVLFGGLAAMVLSYLSMLALGSAYLRFALPRR